MTDQIMQLFVSGRKLCACVIVYFSVYCCFCDSISNLVKVQYWMMLWACWWTYTCHKPGSLQSKWKDRTPVKCSHWHVNVAQLVCGYKYIDCVTELRKGNCPLHLITACATTSCNNCNQVFVISDNESFWLNPLGRIVWTQPYCRVFVLFFHLNKWNNYLKAAFFTYSSECFFLIFV